MFNGIPLSGYAICFAPLALVLIGFIAAATMTDAGARRTYLRRRDTRPEAERPRHAPAVVTSAQDVVTPSGARVTRMPAAAPAATAAGPDDLKKIEGIGPAMARILNEAGITTFAALAAKSPAELQAILDAAGAPRITNPATWPEQAALAAAGNWDALQVLQDSLKGGRAA